TGSSTRSLAIRHSANRSVASQLAATVATGAAAKTTKCNGRLNRPTMLRAPWNRSEGRRRAPERAGGPPRGLIHRQRGAVALGQDADALHVALGLAVGRHAVVLVDRALAGVVAGRGQGQVAVEALEQPRQVLHAAADVLARVE